MDVKQSNWDLLRLLQERRKHHALTFLQFHELCKHTLAYLVLLQRKMQKPKLEESVRTPPPPGPKVSLGSVSVGCVQGSQTLFSDRHQFVQCIGFEEHLSFPLRHGKK